MTTDASRQFTALLEHHRGIVFKVANSGDALSILAVASAGSPRCGWTSCATASRARSISLGIGAAGLLATWWFRRWARRSERADFGRRMDDNLTGGSLRKAKAQLDALVRFEQE